MQEEYGALETGKSLRCDWKYTRADQGLINNSAVFHQYAGPWPDHPVQQLPLFLQSAGSSMAGAQVCVGLIKKCLCASCLPSACGIIKNVVGWGRMKGLLGLPIYEAALMNEEGPCGCSCQTLVFLFGKGALKVFLTVVYCPVSVPTHHPAGHIYP